MVFTSLPSPTRAPPAIRMNSVTSPGSNHLGCDYFRIPNQGQMSSEVTMTSPDEMESYFVEVVGRRDSSRSNDRAPFYISDAQKAALFQQKAARGIEVDGEEDDDEEEDGVDFVSRPRSGIMLHASGRNPQYILDSTDHLSHASMAWQTKPDPELSASRDNTDSGQPDDAEETYKLDRQHINNEHSLPENETSNATLVYNEESDVKYNSASSQRETKLVQSRRRRDLKTMDTARRKQLRFNDTLRMQDVEAKMRAYLKELECHGDDAVYLKEELHLNARDNQSAKLKVLCGFLIDNGYNLCENNMLGSRYKETALDVAIVKGSMECAKVLLDIGGPDIVCKTYTTKQYAGVMPLHLAIIKQHTGLVDYMLSMLDESTKTRVINAKAQGKYFKDKYTCPWVPLALAVGVGHINIFDILLQHGANLLVTDPETGDTILHNLARVAVKVPSKARQMLHRLLHSTEVQIWWRIHMAHSDETMTEVLLRTKNAAGYTPMSYAVCLGATDFAEAILNLDQVYTFPQWHVGPEQANLYEVSEIDPAVAPRNCRVPSVLEMYTFAISDKALPFGNVPHMRHVMERKWKAYKGWFIAWFVYHSLVMISFTIYCTQFHVLPVFISPPVNRNVSLNTNNTDHTIAQALISDDSRMLTWKDYALQALELFVLISACFYFVMELYDSYSLMTKCSILNRRRVRGKQHVFVWLASQLDILRVMLFVFSFCVPTLFILRLVESDWQDVFYATAGVTGWTFMLFFVRALRKIGIFTAMMYRMITAEISHFVLLFTIGLVGCGTGLYTLFSLTPGKTLPAEVANIGQTFFTLFKVIVGLDEFQILEEVRSPWIAKFVFTFFVFFCHILLFNMLIAAMNNTYNRLSGEKEMLWLQLRTKAVLLIERRVARCFRPHHGLEQLHEDKPNLWCLSCEETEKDHPLTNFGFNDDVLSIK